MMPTRRQILVTGTATALWGAAGPWAHTTFAGAPRPDLIVVDDRFGDAAAFAAPFAEAGVPVQPTAGDIGRFWYQSLRDRPRRRIAGMARPSDLFVLETLAREAGLRLVYTGRHDARGRQRQTHTIRMTGDPAAVARVLETRSNAWAPALGRTLAQASLKAGPMRGAQVSRDDPPAADHPGVLVSWLLV